MSLEKLVPPNLMLVKVYPNVVLLTIGKIVY